MKVNARFVASQGLQAQFDQRDADLKECERVAAEKLKKREAENTAQLHQIANDALHPVDLLPPPSPYVVHLQSTFHCLSPPQKGSNFLSVPPCYCGPLPSLPGAGGWPLCVRRAERVQVSVVPQLGPPHRKYPVCAERRVWTLYLGRLSPSFPHPPGPASSCSAASPLPCG